MNMKKSLILGLLATLAIVTTSIVVPRLSSDNSNESSGKLTVATTIYPLFDITRTIGGDHVEVVNILAPGASPHTAEVTPPMIRSLHNAKVIFRIGHELDNWAETITASVPDLTTYTVDENIALLKFEDSHGGEHALDEHACLHVEHGQPHNVTASTDVGYAPDVSRPHTRFDVSSAVDGPGFVEYAVSEASEYAFYLTQALPVSISTSDGTSVAFQTARQAVHDCPDGTEKYVAALERGTYYLQLEPTSKPTTLVIENAHAEDDDHHGHNHGEFDPHYWLDPDNAAIIAETITEQLSILDPSHKEDYQANLEAFHEELRTLNIEAANKLAPYAGRDIVTFHDGWAYFAGAYDLTIAGVFAPSPGKEPGPQYLADLHRSTQEHNIKAVFSEPQLSNETLQPFLQDLGLQLYVLDPLGGAPGRDTYVSLIRHNVDTIVNALSD